MAKFKEGDLVIRKGDALFRGNLVIVGDIHSSGFQEQGFGLYILDFERYKKLSDKELLKMMVKEIEPERIRVKGLDYDLYFRETLDGGQLEIGCQTLTKKEAIEVANLILKKFNN